MFTRLGICQIVSKRFKLLQRAERTVVKLSDVIGHSRNPGFVGLAQAAIIRLCVTPVLPNGTPPSAQRHAGNSPSIALGAIAAERLNTGACQIEQLPNDFHFRFVELDDIRQTKESRHQFGGIGSGPQIKVIKRRRPRKGADQPLECIFRPFR
jgi:hypothetical protein